MTVIGYARVSTTDQDLSIQEAALKAAGCQVIRAEKRSGTTTEGREAFLSALRFARPDAPAPHRRRSRSTQSQPSACRSPADPLRATTETPKADFRPPVPPHIQGAS
jgi:hypothetical protein